MTIGSNIADAGSIPLVDIAPLFDTRPEAWRAPDQALAAAARDMGFACVRGLPSEAAPGPAERARLLAIFRLSGTDKRRLYRRKFAAENPNVYRGWFPLQPGNLTSKEGIDIGGDLVHGPAATLPADPLREPTPLPDEQRLPGWRETAAAYYHAMEQVARALMRSLARSLAVRPDYFDDAFHCGLSTLRLIRYPPRSAAELATVQDSAVWVDFHGARRYLAGAPHTDSGFVTLLAQDGVPGLQALSRTGEWIEVPPLEGTLVVNFGQVLEQWSGGRIRATEHRVLGSVRERFSIPFFYEARADAIIAPLPHDPSDLFAPFEYGEFLWKRMTSFVEFRGMEHARPSGGAVERGEVHMSGSPIAEPTRASVARGRCLCGGVQFEVHGPLRPIVYCHCTQCRRSGGHFDAATACASEHLELLTAESLRWYQSSATARRGFCSTCGTQLFWEPAARDHMSIWAGTLDMPTGLKPSMHIFVAEKGDYYEITDGLPQWPQWPDRSGHD